MNNVQEQGLKSGELIFAENTEFNRFGLISAIVLIVGCSGGLAVGLGAVEHIGALIAVVVPTMLTLSLLLAVSPMRYIMTAGAVSAAINLIMMAYFLIA